MWPAALKAHTRHSSSLQTKRHDHFVTHKKHPPRVHLREFTKTLPRTHAKQRNTPASRMPTKWDHTVSTSTSGTTSHQQPRQVPSSQHFNYVSQRRRHNQREGRHPLYPKKLRPKTTQVHFQNRPTSFVFVQVQPGAGYVLDSGVGLKVPAPSTLCLFRRSLALSVNSRMNEDLSWVFW